jgi:ADP-ribosylglycohydrolase
VIDSRSLLEDKILGSLYGGAAGDAIGAPAEHKTHEQIRERYDWIADIVGPWAGPSDLGKGDGRFTDDTHMIQVLGRMYVEANDHLDVFEFARRIVTLIADEPRYVAEYGRDAPVIERLFYPEKWLLMRLRLANADPRLGGVGNMVNCGAAMYAAPVGMVNAADPDAAYREAIEIFAAHQYSYGLEAAGVLAACVAEALRPGSSVDSIVATALRLAREGTRLAIDAVVNRAATLSDWREAIGPMRDAIRPFDGGAEKLPTSIADMGNGTDDWGPSRIKSIEELPIALGFLVVTGGDLETAIFGGANYGRDCDSIAGMAGSLAGALHGFGAIRPEWVAAIDQQNRCDLRPLAANLASLAIRLQREQLDRARSRADAFADLAAVPV